MIDEMAKKKRRQNKNDNKLGRIYYNSKHPKGYGGVNKLKNASGLTLSKVKQWLSFEKPYSLHKPVRYNFPRRRVIVGGIDNQWQADLIDLSKLKKQNKGFVYLLTCIDVFSKYAWVIPLKNKTGPSLVEAFKLIFEDGRKPYTLQTDKGTEFRNKTFQSFLRKSNIDFFTTENDDIKASIAERFNRTIKEKLWRYFTKTNSERYLEVLPALVLSYNLSFHRSIKMAPRDVNHKNQEDVWQTLYGESDTEPKSRFRFVIGDRVRISKTRRVFKKGYLPSWTTEVFTISQVIKSKPLTYKIKDDDGEELLGTFYKQELQKVEYREKTKRKKKKSI